MNPMDKMRQLMQMRTAAQGGMPPAGQGGMAASNPFVAAMGQKRQMMGGQPSQGGRPQMPMPAQPGGGGMKSMLAQNMLSMSQRGRGMMRPMQQNGMPQMGAPMPTGPSQHFEGPGEMEGDNDADDMQGWRGRSRPMY